MSMLMAALAGANMIYGLGMIDLGMTLDFSQIVIDNELAKMVRKIIGGIPVNDETMAVDVLRQVGCGGHFLQEEHTLKHMRGEQSYTRLFDRRPYGQWKADGGQDLAVRATEEMQHILKNHKPDALDESTAKALDRIIAEAREAWVK